MLEKYLIEISISENVNSFDFKSFEDELEKAGFGTQMRFFGEKERCKLLDGQYFKFSETGINAVMNTVHSIIKGTNAIDEKDYSIVVTLFIDCFKHNV